MCLDGMCVGLRQDQNVLKAHDKMLTVTFTITLLSQYLYSQCHRLLVMHLSCVAFVCCRDSVCLVYLLFCLSQQT